MSSPTYRKRSKSADGSPVKRPRSNSRVKLDELYRLLDKTILVHQVSLWLLASRVLGPKLKALFHSTR